MTKAEELASQITTVLDASPLGWDDKLKALGIARIRLNTSNNGLSDWRQSRIERGQVGSAAKNEKHRVTTPSKKSSRKKD